MNAIVLPVALLAAPAILLCARGDTTRVVISGPDLVAPVVITEQAGRFHVWTGPGTSPNAPQGLIVDWAAGPVSPPTAQPIYRVAFETTRADPNTYTVFYTIDPATNRGFVFVPGPGHPAYRDNTWLILRGVEGKWFRAWKEWESVAHPLLAESPRIR